MTTDPTHYVVLNYATRVIVYSGTSLATTTDRLDPGTVYGTGACELEAQLAAGRQAAKARENMAREAEETSECPS